MPRCDGQYIARGDTLHILLGWSNWQSKNQGRKAQVVWWQTIKVRIRYNSIGCWHPVKVRIKDESLSIVAATDSAANPLARRNITHK